MARHGRGFPIRPHLPKLLTQTATAYTLSANAGSYAVTGAAATFLRGYVVSATGSYAITGRAAAALHGYYVTTTGTYAVSGAAISTLRGYVVSATGTYAITGAAANLEKTGYVLNVTPGAYAITGAAALLARSRILNLSAGFYDIIGSDVQQYGITGYTRDCTSSAIIAGATVRLFRSDTNVLVSSTTSGVDGSYTFTLPPTSTQYFMVAYKSGATNLAGTTARDLVAS